MQGGTPGLRERCVNRGRAQGGGSRASHNKDKDVDKVMTLPLCVLKTACQLSWHYPEPAQLLAHAGQVRCEPKLLNLLLLEGTEMPYDACGTHHNNRGSYSLTYSH